SISWKPRSPKDGTRRRSDRPPRRSEGFSSIPQTHEFKGCTHALVARTEYLDGIIPCRGGSLALSLLAFQPGGAPRPVARGTAQVCDTSPGALALAAARSSVAIGIGHRRLTDPGAGGTSSCA